MLYRTYGLTIESCLPCDELSRGDGPPDVTIRYGKTPEFLTTDTVEKSWFQAIPENLLLSIDGVARYLVSNGKEIVIELSHDADELEVRLFLLGSAFGALLHQRGLLPLHASAIEVNGGCVAIVGALGAGKSTLAAALNKRGYRVMADDVCVVSTDGDGTPLVFPAYPQVKLSADSLKKLGNEPGGLPSVDLDTEKYGLSINEGFCHTPLPLSHIYVLDPSQEHKLQLVPLVRADKLGEIINNTYRFQFLEGLGRKAPHFKQCVSVARHASVTRVIRPSEQFLLDELVALLEEDFLGNTISVT